MYEAEGNSLIDQILQCDRAIHVEVLCMAPPKNSKIVEKSKTHRSSSLISDKSSEIKQFQSDNFDLDEFIKQFRNETLTTEQNESIQIRDYVSRIGDRDHMPSANEQCSMQPDAASKKQKPDDERQTKDSTDNIRQFWSRFGDDAVSDRRLQLWQSLQLGLNEFLTTLQHRESLFDECNKLRCQNVNLRHCLQNVLNNDCQAISE